MNGEHDGTGVPDGTAEGPLPPEELHVARLLAAAAQPSADDDLPPEVAARLDDVLADLVAERRDGSPSAEVPATLPGDEVVGTADLASRRRRRWPVLLVAAAAVSVVGLGLGNVMDDLSGGAGADSASVESLADGAAEAPAEEQGVPGSSAPDPAARAPGQAPPERNLSADEHPAAAGPLELRRDSLVADLERAELSRAALAAQPREYSDTACARPRLGSGDEWLEALLDGEPAVLVMRAPSGGRRTAEVFTCDDPDTPAASVRIDAR